MNNEMNGMELLKQITAAHFMVEDLQLYLDTHPMDRDAVAKYNSFINKLTSLQQAYNRSFGMISQDSSLSPFPWQWICEPWPWECEANFKLCGEER